jgi:hypothetical protein
MGLVARTGFVTYEEMRKYLTIFMRRTLVIYDICNRSLLNFLIYEENFILFFISVL